MSTFAWLQSSSGGGSVSDASSGTKGIIKLTNDLGGSADLPSIIKINGSTVPAGGSLTTGQILRVTGASTLGYGALNLANSSAVTGILPNTNLPDATSIAKGILQLTGDIGGSATSPSVLKINGTSISSSPSVNQILMASSSSTSSWTLLSDANIASSAAIAASKLAYTDNATPILGAVTVQTALDAIKVQAVANSIQRLTQTVSTANLQAAGAILTSSFNIGSALPANSRVLGVEINVTQILSGIGLSVALVTVQSTGDIVGSLIASNTLLISGLYGGTGTNKYLSRGGQQLTATVTLTGALLSTLTAGAFTVNVFYAIVT